MVREAEGVTLFVRTLTAAVIAVLMSGLLIGCAPNVCPVISGDYCVDCGE